MAEEQSMKKTLMIVTIAGLIAGCSSEPVKEQPKATAESRPAAPLTPRIEPKVEPKAVTKPVEAPRIAVDPLNDPNSLLSKRSIYYDFDKSAIKDQDKPLIQAHAGYLVGHHAAKVRIEGNCDERGSREYNLALGQRRADSVKSALKVLGAADVQIDTVSWGEEKPKAAGHDEAAWAENRRSDIIYERAQ
jgi:peptidoglycan-associated lipoprotein